MIVSTALQVALSTAQISDLHWDGARLWAATSGGVEVWSPDGTRQAHEVAGLPVAAVAAVGEVDGQIVVGTEVGALAYVSSGDWQPLSSEPAVAVLTEGAMSRSGWLYPRSGYPADFRPPSGAPVTDAISVDGVVVTGTLSGEVLIYGAGLRRIQLPGVVMDLAEVDGAVHVALSSGAARIGLDGSVEHLPIAASSAGTLWGTTDGQLLDGAGRIGQVPHPVRAIVELPGGVLAVGTEDGLYQLGEAGTVRLTPEGQLCGNFITGLARWQGELVATTFQDGVCVQGTDGHWRPLQGLPTQMFNAVLVDGADLLLASAEGLVRVSPSGVVSVTEEADPDAGRRAPGLHHRSVTSLARGDRLWITDLAGPIAVDGQGRWRRYRYHVWSTSNQRVSACGSEAWVATEDAGVSWFDGRGWQHFDALTGLPDDWIMAVACTGPSAGLAGTYQDGVWRFDGVGWSELPGIPDPWVLSLMPDGEDVWAGTMGGLYRWSAGGWSDAVAGLPDPRVHVLLAEEGALWVGTENGLALVEP